MRISKGALVIGVLILGLGLDGCGGGSRSTAASTGTAGAREAARASTRGVAASRQLPRGAPSEGEKIHLPLSSEVFQAGLPIPGGEREIPALYTCDGRNISPPLHWSGVPAGSAELVLLVLDLTASSGDRRLFDWAIAGLRPTLKGISAGVLPAGAVVGHNDEGQNRYSVCPPKGRLENYAVLLYAPSHALSLKPGFDPNSLYEQMGGSKLPEGQSGFAYRRS